MKKTFGVIAILSMTIMVFLRCNNPGENKEDKGKTEAVLGAEGPVDTNFTINFNPFPPTDLDENATPKMLVQFAWEEFLALNWKSSFGTNKLRDFPDTTWTYEKEPNAYPELDVWETYAHRSELRPFSNKMLPFDNAPHYSIGASLLPSNGASYLLFDNLDENNEIGSCNMYAHVNKYQKTYQVLYQAKVNRYEYEYIRNNYPDSLSLARAVRRNVANIAKDSAYYKGGTTTCSCPRPDSVVCLPCGSGKSTGTMEIKSAWRELTPLDDSTKFFTRKVIYYTMVGNQIYYNNKTYALIGLHIIHKTQNYPAFVFATWEHVDVKKDSMGYVLLDNNGNEYGPITTPMRDPIVPITEAATRYVHRKLPAKSIWQNYRLVGVQATPSPDTTSYSFFLANYVVESDYTLNHFRGSGIGTPHNNGINTLFKGKFYSAGGCQGCHGAAQTHFGTDFSFLLDSGNGKPVIFPDIGEKTAKLPRLIRSFERADKKILELKGK